MLLCCETINIVTVTAATADTLRNHWHIFLIWTPIIDLGDTTDAKASTTSLSFGSNRRLATEIGCPFG